MNTSPPSPERHPSSLPDSWLSRAFGLGLLVIVLAMHGRWIALHSSPMTDEAKHLRAAQAIAHSFHQRGPGAAMGLAWRQSYDYPPLYRVSLALPLLLTRSLDSAYMMEIAWLLLPFAVVLTLRGDARAAALLAVFLTYLTPGMVRYWREAWPDGAFLSLIASATLAAFGILREPDRRRHWITLVLALTGAALVRQTAVAYGGPLLVLVAASTAASPARRKEFPLAVVLAVGSVSLCLIASWYGWAFPAQRDVIGYHAQAGTQATTVIAASGIWLRQIVEQILGLPGVLLLCLGIVGGIRTGAFTWRHGGLALCGVVPAVLICTLPNKEIRFTQPGLFSLYVLAMVGHYHAWQRWRLAIVASALVTVGTGLFLTFPLSQGSRRWSVPFPVGTFAVVFGNEFVWGPEGSSNRRDQRTFHLRQPLRSFAYDWKVESILTSIHASQPHSRVLWLASNVNVAGNVAEVLATGNSLPLQIVRPWPFVAERPPSAITLGEFDAVVVGPVHPVTYNMPWGDRLRRFQAGARRVLGESGVVELAKERLPNGEFLTAWKVERQTAPRLFHAPEERMMELPTPIK